MGRPALARVPFSSPSCASSPETLRRAGGGGWCVLRHAFKGAAEESQAGDTVSRSPWHSVLAPPHAYVRGGCPPAPHLGGCALFTIDEDSALVLYRANQVITFIPFCSQRAFKPRLAIETERPTPGGGESPLK